MAGRNCCKTIYAHKPSHAMLGLGETPESCGRTFCDELEQKSGRPETFSSLSQSASGLTIFMDWASKYSLACKVTKVAIGS